MFASPVTARAATHVDWVYHLQGHVKSRSAPLICKQGSTAPPKGLGTEGTHSGHTGRCVRGGFKPSPGWHRSCHSLRDTRPREEQGREHWVCCDLPGAAQGGTQHPPGPAPPSPPLAARRLQWVQLAGRCSSAARHRHVRPAGGRLSGMRRRREPTF